MKILALDTSTEACSAAVLNDDVIASRYTIAPRQHAELVLSMCDEVLGEAGCTLQEIDAIAFGRGPGAFTGVRIATGVVQGMAFAHKLPVVPISSLAAMAHVAWRKTGAKHIMTAIDARINEVYWACYECSEEGIVEVIAERVCLPADIELPTGGEWLGVGTGWQTYQQALSAKAAALVHEEIPELFPDATDIAQLARHEVIADKALPAEMALPVYLRDDVAKKKSNQ